MIPHEAVLNKAKDRKFERDPSIAPNEDYHDILDRLEAEGEWVVDRVPEPYIEIETKYGRKKKIPIEKTWHHKSCGQCGHIPGYSTAIFWINRKLGLDYHDPTDQTSCTAWNYYASATSNAAAQAAVAMRNFAAAQETGYFPIIHCATSFGHYKETREQLIHSPELRKQVREIMAKLGKKLVMPEEIVHYSEWVHAMRDRIAEHQVLDMSHLRATIHPACHYHKLVGEDAVYSPEVYGAQRTAIITGLLQTLGVDVRDYSTWFDCCGFGFRHILVSRDFSRSFAVQRKIEVMKEEADPDILITHDTGCVTTLDQSQFAARASSDGRLAARGARHGRAPLQGAPAALAQHGQQAVPPQARRRRRETVGRVRGIRRTDQIWRKRTPELGRRRCLICR